MEKSSFFGSVNKDRLYTSARFAEYFGSLVGNGVFLAPQDGLKAAPGPGANVVLSAGKAWINGYFYYNTEPLALTVAMADELPRHDRVVIRWSLETRSVYAAVAKGAPGSAEPPPVTRTADAYELGVAVIRVAAGAIELLPADISDTRPDAAVCGFVAHMLQSLDITAFLENAQRQLEEQQADWDAFFAGQQAIWGNWIAQAIADPANYFQRNFDNPAMYVGSTRWKTKVGRDVTLEEIRAGQAEDGALAASRKTTARTDGADVEHTFYDLQTGEAISAFIERCDKVSDSQVKNWVEAVS